MLAIRLCCDDLAPWAGVTPEQAATHVAALADLVDLLTVVRGGPFSTSAYRPDGHTAPQFNLELTARMREAVGGRVPVALQGSVVEPTEAEAALDAGAADLIEMTRAQIAEPRLVALVRAGTPERIRPCILCNQACRVRDNRNPIVSCVTEPRSGHETEDPPVEGADQVARDVLVLGGGVAGLECARVLAGRGHHVTVAERRERLGGVLRTVAVGAGRDRLARFTDLLEAECRRLGPRPAERRYPPAAPPGAEIADPAGHPGPDAPPEPDSPSAPGSASAPAGAGGVASSGSTRLIDVLELLDDGVGALPAGPVAVHDPIGGPIGVAVAEWLAAAGREASLITPDQIAGTLLSLSGDLADANGRLQRAGVRRELRALIREVGDGRATLEDVWTGARRQIGCAALIDCGHRLPEESLYLARPGTPRAGDCVAPRTVLEAVLDGRRRAVEISARQVPLGADN